MTRWPNLHAEPTGIQPLPEACGASAPSEPQSPAGMIATLREWFGCRAGCARLIARLYAAEGQVVARRALAADLGQTLVALKQDLVIARAAMDPGSISTRHGQGLYLTAIGLEDCRRALADARARRAA